MCLKPSNVAGATKRIVALCNLFAVQEYHNKTDEKGETSDPLGLAFLTDLPGTSTLF